MDNRSILVLAVIGVLVLGTIAVVIASSTLNSNVLLDNNAVVTGNTQSAGYSDNLVYSSNYQDDNVCGYRDNYPCFDYLELEQERGDSDYSTLKQTRLEPCNPKPICPLCREEVKQARGNGYEDRLIKTRINC